MNYTNPSLRGGGGGGCCKNKNNKTFTINSVDENRETFDYEDEDFSDFSSSRELEEFETNDDEDQACWNITEDDSFTLLTGKYESMNRHCLEDEDNEEDEFLDQYLLSMSPIVDKKKSKERNEKKTFGTFKTLPRRPHDVSVKCSDSTEEIIGTPSEVALKLNDAVQNYLPRRKSRIEKEVSKEAAVAMDDDFEKEPEEEPIMDLCCEEEPPCIPEKIGCPGTFDRLRRKNVPCADALTLREIALGRRIKRPKNVLPVENGCDAVRTAQPITRINADVNKDNCCCSKKHKRHEKPPQPPTQKGCCTKQPRTNKSVSFSF